MEEIRNIDDLFSARAETLLILGNGFDLDLGWQTRYSDFAQSANFWPFNPTSSTKLAKFLYECSFSKSWFDLENNLAIYGSSKASPLSIEFGGGMQVREDKEDYGRLVSSLFAYLKEQEKQDVDKNSYSSRILKAVCDNITPGTIYSFNYTDLSTIATKLGISSNCCPIYVHGSLERKNIILGVGDYEQLPSSFDFAYKTSNSNYISTHLLEDLLSYKNVVIFGLSLSKVDYPYFEDFFRQLSEGKIKDLSYEPKLQEDPHTDISNENVPASRQESRKPKVPTRGKDVSAGRKGSPSGKIHRNHQHL